MATAGKTVTVAYESPKALKRAIGKAKPLRWMRGKGGGYVSHDGVLGVYGVHQRSPNRRRGILPWPVTLRGAEIHAADTAGDAKAYAAYYDEITQKCPPVAVVAPGRPVSAFTGRVIPEGVMEHAGVSYNDRVRVCLAAMGSPSPDADVDSSRAYLEGMKRTEVSPAMAASVIFATLHHGHVKHSEFAFESRIDDDPRDLPWQDYDAFFGAARGKKFRTVVYTRKGIAIANLSRVFTDKAAARTDGYDLLSEHPNLGAFIVLDENGKQIWIGRREGFERMQNRSARRRMAQMATPDEASEERAGLRWTEISFDVRSDAAKFSRLIQKKHSEIVASHEGLIVTTNATGADIRNVLQGNTWEEGYRLGRNVDMFDLAAEARRPATTTHLTRAQVASMNYLGTPQVVSWPPFTILMQRPDGTTYKAYSAGRDANHAVQNMEGDSTVGPNDTVVSVEPYEIVRSAYEAAAEECPCPHGGEEAPQQDRAAIAARANRATIGAKVNFPTLTPESSLSTLRTWLRANDPNGEYDDTPLNDAWWLIEEQVVDYASETRRPKARRAKR